MNSADNKVLVVVYGTLKRGMCNHHLLSGADFLGEDCLHGITLYDLGPYPGAKAEQSEGIGVEVYAVTAAELEQLDLLEEYRAEAPEEGEYTRVAVETAYGPAWIYLYNPDVSNKPVQRWGSWQPVITTGH
ncbi:MAG TPA: gamma-glutamylcyclotransferase family protein [Pseudohongiella sp.]|nr:gamma-glutamylcyclotransferase family protein [Pseudohongiella sp.]